MVPDIDEYKERMWSRFRVWVKHEFNMTLPEKYDPNNISEKKLFNIDDLLHSFAEGIHFSAAQTLQALQQNK